MKYLLEGIQFNDDDYIFDFKNDTEHDIVNLKFQKYNKSFSVKNKEVIFYAYKINKGVKSELVTDFRNKIKSFKYPTEINLMIDKSINGFNQLYTLSQFDLIITPKSSSPLNNIISTKIKNKAGTNTLIANDAIVKNSIENIQIDLSKIKDEKLKAQLLKLISQEDEFKIKNVPPMFRRLYTNYLNFDTELSRRIYNSIKTGNILLIDDILTTSSTLLEMGRLVKSMGCESITFYVFLSNKK